MSLALGRDVLRAGHQPKAAKPLGLSIQPVLDDRTIRGELANPEEKKKLAEQIAIMGWLRSRLPSLNGTRF